MPSAPPFMVTRRARRRLVAVVAVGALASIAATCQAAKPPAPPPPPPPPPPPSVYCHPSTPANAQGYQAAFDGLFAANTKGWVATDGGLPVPLTDGRVLWMFGDTLIGAPPSGPVTLLGIHNNGLVVQDLQDCFTPMQGEAIPVPGNHWIWPTGAVEQGNTLRVFGFRMQPASGEFPWQLVRMEVATFSLPGLTFQGLQQLPVPTNRRYGETVLVDEAEGFVYAYGQERQDVPNFFPIPTHYVARAPIGSVPAGPWKFWSGNDPLGEGIWVEDPDLAAPMLFENPDEGIPGPSPTEGPLAGFAVGTNGPSSYLGSSFMIDVFSNDAIWAWDSDAPQGPWIRRATPAVDISHQNLHPSRQFAYGGRVVFDVPGSSPIGLWSTNHKSFNAVLANPNLYKVWFAPPG